jgi:3-hydroxyisobutyrate dehydrogenase-like beta-hydroxyacid dehydrogenase
MRSVAIIGLGEIGAGVAQALAKSGQVSLSGFDLRAEPFEKLGGAMRVCSTPAAAGDGADVVLVAVMTDDQVREVLTGEAGVLTAQAPPHAIVILSTVSMETIFWAADEATSRGVALLDCGVSGGAQALREASITAMVGGEDNAFEQVRPVIEGFSNPVVHCGKLGNGMRAKLARNLIIYTDWMVAWEGARLALAAGVPRDKFVQVVTASDRWVRPHMALVERGVGLADGGETAAVKDDRTAKYADKDLRAAIALGEELGIELPAAALALGRFRAVTGLE